MPFEAKARAADIDQALGEIVALHHQIIRDPKVGQRAVAICQALDKGASLREIAELLGVSPETVRKYQKMA